MSAVFRMKPDKRRILFVGGLPSLTTEEMLWNHFSEYAEITNVKIIRDKKSWESKGYAYVTLADASSVGAVCCHVHVVLERRLDVQLATKKGERHVWKTEQLRRRLFVTGLPETVQHDDLFEAFGQFGAIHNAYVIVDFETKKLKSYGYVEFEEEESAQLALESLVYVRGVLISVSIQKDLKCPFPLPQKQESGEMLPMPKMFVPNPSTSPKRLPPGFKPSVHNGDVSKFKDLTLNPWIYLNVGIVPLLEAEYYGWFGVGTEEYQQHISMLQQASMKQPLLLPVQYKPKVEKQPTLSVGQIQRMKYILSHKLSEGLDNYTFRVEHPGSYTSRRSPGIPADINLSVSSGPLVHPKQKTAISSTKTHRDLRVSSSSGDESL